MSNRSTACLLALVPRVAALAGTGSGSRSHGALLATAAWSVARSLNETECAGTDEPGGCSVLEENRPLLLVVCGDEAQLADVRSTLRAAGFLSTSGRSVEAAVNLLTQVRVDGCVVAQPLDAADGRRLRDRLEHYNAGCVRVCVTKPGDAAPDGWSCCDGHALPERLRELFR